MVPQDPRALLILVTVVPRPASPWVSQHEGGPRSCCLPFPSPCLPVPWAPLEGTQCPVFFLSHVSLLTEQRRSGNEPRVPTPHPHVRTGYKRGEVIAVTSEVWAPAQDSNQPETHKDQSTSERSRPGPQAKPAGKGLTGKGLTHHTPHRRLRQEPA